MKQQSEFREINLTFDENIDGRLPAWGAVFSMALCVFVLIASEFLPVSLLTLDLP